MQTGYFLEELKQVIIKVKVSYLSLRVTLFSITYNFKKLFKSCVFFFSSITLTSYFYLMF